MGLEQTLVRKSKWSSYIPFIFFIYTLSFTNTMPETAVSLAVSGPPLGEHAMSRKAAECSSWTPQRDAVSVSTNEVYCPAAETLRRRSGPSHTCRHHLIIQAGVLDPFDPYIISTDHPLVYASKERSESTEHRRLVKHIRTRTRTTIN